VVLGEYAMFEVRYNQVNIKRRITVALALIVIMACTVDVQLYREQRILVHKVTCTIKLKQHENYFDMSLKELMNVVVVSELAERPAFCLLDPHS
jgi:hypothetical protein